jgi:hypothetical protein
MLINSIRSIKVFFSFYLAGKIKDHGGEIIFFRFDFIFFN